MEKLPEQTLAFHNETLRRIKEMPGVDGVSFGAMVPWRDAGVFGPGFEFSADGHVFARRARKILAVGSGRSRRDFSSRWEFH